jgi:hypothetical protein
MKSIAKQTTVKACEVCKRTKLSTGERLHFFVCHSACYCSKSCQKRDWPAHKLTCEGRRVWKTEPRASARKRW